MPQKKIILYWILLNLLLIFSVLQRNMKPCNKSCIDIDFNVIQEINICKEHFLIILVIILVIIHKIIHIIINRLCMLFTWKWNLGPKFKHMKLSSFLIKSYRPWLFDAYFKLKTLSLNFIAHGLTGVGQFVLVFADITRPDLMNVDKERKLCFLWAARGSMLGCMRCCNE